MQRLLWTVTALAALLVAAIIVVPRLIDWNQYRAEIAAAAERATGRPVTIEGEINLLLLPTPTLSAARVRVGNPASFAQSATGFADIKSLDARFALWPLLLGRVEIESVALIEPKLTLVQLPDGSSNWHLDDVVGAVAFDRLIVVGGSLDWAGPHPDRVSQINAELVDQPTPDGTAGGWHFAGEVQFHELAWQGNLTVGPPGSAGRPATASLALRGGGATMRLGGTVSGADWRSAAFAGKLTGDAQRIPVLLRLLGLVTPAALTERGSIEAGLTANANGLALSDIAIVVGDLRLAGRVDLAFDPDLAVTAQLSANRLELARWLAIAPPGAEAVVTPIASFTGAALPNAKIELAVDAIFWREGLIRGAKLQASVQAGQVTVRQASAQLPGGSDLSLFGKLSPGANWRFAGRMEAGSDNLRALLAWLAVDIGGVAPDRLRRAAATAAFDAAADRIDISALDLSFDSSKLTGDIGVTFGARLGATANLDLDRANLDAYLPSSLAGLDGAWRDTTDLALRLHGDQLTWRDLPLADAGVAVTLHDGNFETAANVADFAGGRMQLSGRLAEGAGADGQVDATLRLSVPDAARLAALIQPDAVLPSLGPGDLKLDLHGPVGHPAATLSATVAGATIDADGTAAFDAIPASITIGIDHPSALGLLQRFVPSYLPNGDAAGPLALAAHLVWQGGIATLEDITARIGPTNLVGKLSLDRTASRPRLVASLAASALDLGVLLPSGNQLAADWPAALDMDFGLRIGAIDAGPLSFGDFAATGSVRQRLLTIPDLSARWLGGTLTGAARSELGAVASLDLDLKLAGGAVGEAAAMLVGDPDPKGSFDLAAKLTGSGSDLRSLMASLGGSGKLQMGAGSVEGFDLAQAAALLLSNEPLGSLLPKVTTRLSGGTTRYRAAEGEIKIDGGSVRAIDGLITLDASAAVPSLAVSADLASDRIDIAAIGVKAPWRLRISGALAAQLAASASPAATKIYDLLTTGSP